MGDQSDFVTGFSRTLAEAAPRLGPALSPLHFRYFCDKLSVSFCPRYYEYIFRCVQSRAQHALVPIRGCGHPKPSNGRYARPDGKHPYEHYQGRGAEACWKSYPDMLGQQ